MFIVTIGDFRRAIRHGPYAWPGGYPVYFITQDGGALSFKTASEERRQILDSICRDINDGWRVVAMVVNWDDNSLFCDHTGEKIEVAYESEET